ERIELRNAANGLEDVVSYKPGFPWPTAGSHENSIELINPAFDNDVAGNWRASGNVPDGQISHPTPGGINSTYSENAAPFMRQLLQSIQQPPSGQDVTITIKVTDHDGIASVALDYQVVSPGNYIRLTDVEYENSWTTIAMRDDGAAGDALAGDGIYTV